MFQVVRTEYVTGVSAKTPAGRLFAGHMSPVHKEPSSVSPVRNIFTTHDIIAGDFNAAKFHLQREGILGDSLYSNVGVPTYLPSIPRPAGRIRVPCFDDVYIRVGIGSVKSVDLPTPLPESVYDANPRDLMQTLDLDSDHVPLAVTLTVNKASDVRLATYNVADPFFWAEYYKGADAGFAAKGAEPLRKQRILKTLQSLLTDRDCVSLQEVPAAWVDDILSVAARAGYHAASTPMYCKANPSDPKVSYVVLLFKTKWASQG